MRKATIGLLTFFRFGQLWQLGWAAFIIPKALRQPTLFDVMGCAAFLLIVGVLIWMMQEMINDVKRWDRSSPGD